MVKRSKETIRRDKINYAYVDVIDAIKYLNDSDKIVLLESIKTKLLEQW